MVIINLSKSWEKIKKSIIITKMIYADDDDDNDYNDDDNILVVDKVAFSPLYPGRIESWGVGLCGGRKDRETE